MEIILLEDVASLGKRGAAVKVADGFARNYLIPRKLAIAAVGNSMAVFRARERARQTQEGRQRQAAEKLRAELMGVTLEFSVQTGEEDQLYGSISAHDLQEALKAKGYDVERKNIRLADPIRALGVFDVPIHLFQEIEAPVKVWVVRQ
ncbi:MAG TPA: 50S ribosomal protein L9 [Candidatus Eisenbacteria bacterium]|jgi:large subunit ribosomal protein L9